MGMTTTQNLTDNVIAVRGPVAWEIYYVVDGLEMFSHYATAREAAELDRREAWGGTWA